MDGWTIVEESFEAKDPLFLEGLPGIGNVGKVVVDFLVEKSEAKKVVSFSSRTLPNSVFVTEDNLVELPSISIYHAKILEQDYLFMTGDVQPSDEVSSYIFCEKVVAYLQKQNCQGIVTLGGVGLQEIPEEPKVLCTGNNKEFIQTFVDAGADPEVYGVVGPIIGVSGLLLGLSKNKIKASALLAETFGHPMFLGLRGAKAILTLFQKRFSFTYPLDEIDKEIEEVEEDKNSKPNPKIETINKLKKHREMSYIG